MSPSDLAFVMDRVRELDAAGAARELALALRLDSDSAEVVEAIVQEAFQAGRHQAHVEFDKNWIEEAWL